MKCYKRKRPITPSAITISYAKHVIIFFLKIYFIIKVHLKYGFLRGMASLKVCGFIRGMSSLKVSGFIRGMASLKVSGFIRGMVSLKVSGFIRGMTSLKVSGFYKRDGLS